MNTRERQAQVCAWAAASCSQEAWMVLDTETTGLSSEDEVIEIALVTSSGKVAFSSLIQPEDPQRTDLATAIHGITTEMLAQAPRFPDIWPSLEALLQRTPHVLVYNAAFDHRLLAATAQRYGDMLPVVTWSCVMEQYAVFHGAWNRYHQSYTWQRLQVACQCLGVQVSGEYHRATADALATLGVVRALAALHTPEEEVQV